MKYFLIIFLFFNYSLSHGQDSTFSFTKQGFTDYVVAKVDGKSQSDLYKKAIDWISVTYKNPNQVIKAKIENEYIRFEGSNSSLICTKVLGLKSCDMATYQIEISFKDGKYKFDVIELKYYQKPSQYTSGGWFEIGLPTPKVVEVNPEAMNAYFNDDGEVKKIFRFYVEDIPNEFNSLNNSLKDFLLNDKLPSQQKDW